MINLNNYEKYFIDYLDNQLTKEEIAELMLFLDAHPQLKDDFDSLLNAPVLSTIDDQCVFEHKEKIKKPIYNKQQIYRALVNELEGEISNHERQMLSSISADFINTEREWFKKTKLIPNKDIVFEKKNKLYKQAKIRSLAYYYVSGIAAAVLFLFGFALWKFEFKGSNSGSNPIVSDLSKKKVAPQSQTIEEKSSYRVIAKAPGRVSKLNSVESFPSSDTALVEQVILNSSEENTEGINLIEPEYESEMGSIDKNLIIAEVKNNPLNVEHVITELTPADWVYKRVVGELPERGTHHRWMNILSFAAHGIERLTGKKAEAKKVEKGCITKYQFKIGGIELEHTIACK